MFGLKNCNIVEPAAFRFIKYLFSWGNVSHETLSTIWYYVSVLLNKLRKGNIGKNDKTYIGNKTELSATIGHATKERKEKLDGEDVQTSNRVSCNCAILLS